MVGTSYDEVPYPSHPFPETQPRHLATVARIFGLASPPPDACRVLELGCAAGGNLLPLASAWPKCRFVGIDLSARQVAEGRARLDRLGLSNAELLHANILELDAELGTFDYIVCHGVYSWVPRAVQDRILAICRENLAPAGVAYVSYNTYPGWHLMSAIRDMMLYHAERFASPASRITQARAFLDFLARWAPARDDAYGTLLRAEAASLRQATDAYLYHEHLETVNDPIYFREFIQRTRDAGLQYLAEAQIRAMLPAGLPPEVRESLRLLAPDPLDLEQYLDFLRNRTFRRSLLCHAEVPLDRTLDGAGVRDLRASCALRMDPPESVLTGEGESRFVGQAGGTLTTRDRVMKGVLVALREAWPGALEVGELASVLASKLGPLDAATAREIEAPALCRRLLDYYIHDIVELDVVPPPVAPVSDSPVASAIARLDAEAGEWVTNLRHQRAALSPRERQLLGRLDGSRSVAELAASDGPDVLEGLRLLAEKSLLVSPDPRPPS